MSSKLHHAYTSQISVQVFDRNHNLLETKPNSKGAYMVVATSSVRVRQLVVLSEDKYFYQHFGVNPLSIFRSIINNIFYSEHAGGSTITQQLVKNLLGHENARTVTNKLIELCYAIALELHTSKQEILTMYLSSAYFGNQIQGIEGASRYYFGKESTALEDGEVLRLFALLNSPSFEPGTAGNTARALLLGKRTGVTTISEYHQTPIAVRESKKDPAMFELKDLISCTEACTLSVDRELTQKIRHIISSNLSSPKFKSVSNAAVAVIKLGKNGAPNQLLALIGTPDPYGNTGGSQINMALQPRPIGSTWKPFIYGVATEKGARPYTLIDDAEYRFEIGTGYAFYPKNYDGIYRGPVTLNYALSNSLNVPAVRALQFDNVDNFGVFMQRSLGFIPQQSFDTYQLSIALGGLEMNPLLLAEYFSVFPREGILAPLTLHEETAVDVPMMRTISAPKRIFAATTTELITKMLTDRLMGVEQFGLESNLNLPFAEYAVKTGTTYDYHDSWTVGYTPDVVVVSWIGNSNNKAMDLLSGARGAGKIWHDVMALLLARGDILPQKFNDRDVVPITTGERNSFGLLGDDIEHSRMIMKGDDVIHEPHDGDVLLFQKGMTVPLRATEPLRWSVDGITLGKGTEVYWTPHAPGSYLLTAKEEGSEKPKGTLHISIVAE
jgi:membrane carboxypeptidase/penicillin-binding protein PbpC